MLPKKVGWLDHLAAEMEEPYTFVNNTVINGPSIKVFIGTGNGNDAKKIEFYKFIEKLAGLLQGKMHEKAKTFEALSYATLFWHEFTFFDHFFIKK